MCSRAKGVGVQYPAQSKEMVSHGLMMEGTSLNDGAAESKRRTRIEEESIWSNKLAKDKEAP